MSNLRVVLADGNSLARRAGVRLLTEAGFVVADTDDGVETVRLCERHRPDVLVAADRLPGLHASQVLRALPEATRPAAVIVTGSDDGALLLDGLGAGARGFVHVGTALRELVEAVQVVAEGGYWLRPPLCSQVFASAGALVRHLADDPLASLTEREREVFILAARGYPTGDIGPLLHISPRTVEAHRTRAFRKLGLGSLREAIRFSATRGLLLEG